MCHEYKNTYIYYINVSTSQLFYIYPYRKHIWRTFKQREVYKSNWKRRVCGKLVLLSTAESQVPDRDQVQGLLTYAIVAYVNTESRFSRNGRKLLWFEIDTNVKNWCSEWRYVIFYNPHDVHQHLRTKKCYLISSTRDKLTSKHRLAHFIATMRLEHFLWEALEAMSLCSEICCMCGSPQSGIEARSLLE